MVIEMLITFWGDLKGFPGMRAWKLDERVSGFHRHHGIYAEADRHGSGVMDTNLQIEGARQGFERRLGIKVK